MTGPPHPPAGSSGGRASLPITLLFQAVLAGAIVLALAILFIPGPAFLAYSNYLQIFAALFGSLAFIWRWNWEKKEAFLWAAAALGLWGIANIGWYASVLAGQRALVFPSFIDIGMIGSFFLLAVAVYKGFPERDASPLPAMAVLAACLLVPAAIIVTTGTGTATVATLLYFLACGILLGECIRHPGTAYPGLVTGSVFFALAFMVYPIRESFFVQDPISNIIGPMVSAGFALIVLGWPART